jgi:2-keto-4-pentenoate hydratase/2-oxohepta-3-ene-1,7-dioic acid hydratase in catechol pathway
MKLFRFGEFSMSLVLQKIIMGLTTMSSSQRIVGLGFNPPRYLKPGDIVELGIDKLGKQK